MTKPKKLTLLAGLLILWVFIIACDLGSGGANEVGKNYNSFTSPLTGQVTGTAQSIWLTVNQSWLICPDPAAQYTMTVAVDSKLPADTHLTSPIPPKSHYFRIDAIAILRYQEEGHCLERDALTDTIHSVIEGSYDGVNYNILSCSIWGKPTSAEIHYGDSMYTISAEITCTANDQHREVFSFSDLILK